MDSLPLRTSSAGCCGSVGLTGYDGSLAVTLGREIPDLGLNVPLFFRYHSRTLDEAAMGIRWGGSAAGE